MICNITDANLRAKLKALDYGDTQDASAGIFSFNTDPTTITSIDVSDSYISNLKGIEYLTL